MYLFESLFELINSKMSVIKVEIIIKFHSFIFTKFQSIACFDEWMYIQNMAEHFIFK